MSTTTILRTTTMKPSLMRRRHCVYPAHCSASSKKRSCADICDSDRNNKKTTLKNSSFRTLEHTDQRQRQRHPNFKAGGDIGDRVRRVDSMEKKKNITKSEDIRIRAPVQYTNSETKNDDLIQPAAEERLKLVRVEVERLGGLKFRFRFSGNKSSAAATATGVVKNVELTKSTEPLKKRGLQETTERHRFGTTSTVVKNLAVSKTTEPNCSAAAAARVKKRGLQETTEQKRCDTTAVVKNPAVQETPYCWRLWRQIKLQREREAARRKIESMTKTVDIPNNYYDIMGKLDRMFGDSEWVMEAFYGARNEKPLEKLGLFLKA